MPSRLNEFTRFLNEFGPRAFDQLAVGRLGASIAAASQGIPADITPLDGLAAHWSTLSSDEKTTFFRRLGAGAPARTRSKARKSARTAVAGKTAAVAKPKREAKDARAASEKKKKNGKKAKKEAKVRAKEAKKLRKKEAKAKEKAEKKAKKMAKAAEKKAKAAQLATTT